MTTGQEEVMTMSVQEEVTAVQDSSNQQEIAKDNAITAIRDMLAAGVGVGRRDSNNQQEIISKR